MSPLGPSLHVGGRAAPTNTTDREVHARLEEAREWHLEGRQVRGQLRHVGAVERFRLLAGCPSWANALPVAHCGSRSSNTIRETRRAGRAVQTPTATFRHRSRNVGREILEGIRPLKRGQHGRAATTPSVALADRRHAPRGAGRRPSNDVPTTGLAGVDARSSSSLERDAAWWRPPQRYRQHQQIVPGWVRSVQQRAGWNPAAAI
jgi:hypothetical protein